MIRNCISTRDRYFDSLKFVLITLVVLGHCLEQNIGSRFSLALYNTIYTFHMPLFIFISGYFCKKYTCGKKAIKSLLVLTESLVIFQFLHKFPVILNGKESIWYVIINPAWTMWYLYSLITWKISIYIYPPRLLNTKYGIVPVLILCIVAGFIPITNALSFQRTMVFMPFFFLGYYCREGYIDFRKYHFNKRVSFLLLILVLAFMFLVDRELSFILWGEISVFSRICIIGPTLFLDSLGNSDW